MSIATYLAWTRAGRRYPPRPAQAPLPPPVPPPVPLVVTLGGGERFYRCRGCDVAWQGTDPACWCCGEVAA